MADVVVGEESARKSAPCAMRRRGVGVVGWEAAHVGGGGARGGVRGEGDGGGVWAAAAPWVGAAAARWRE